MKTDLQTFLDMLEGAGYTRHTGEISNPECLPHKEYLVWSHGAGQTLWLGRGMGGDTGCSMSMVFKADGAFHHHSADHEGYEGTPMHVPSEE